jgi:hypothetical protein
MDDQEEFLAFLKQSGVILICPDCGGQSWSVVRGDLAIPDPPGGPKPVFLIRCNVCGHERFFSPEDPGGQPAD